MKLYHVSRDIELKEKTFRPRVPANRLKEESNSIKRICTSTSLEGAINGFPFKSILVNEDMLKETNAYLNVYTFNSKNLNTKKVTTEDVPDADLSDEHWILEDVSASPEIIKINSIKLDKYNKYINEYTGKVVELDYEPGVADYDRELEHSFILRSSFSRFKNIFKNTKIEYDVVEDKKIEIRHFYGIPATKTYSLITIKLKVEKGVDISPLWKLGHYETKYARRKKLSLFEFYKEK